MNDEDQIVIDMREKGSKQTTQRINEVTDALDRLEQTIKKVLNVQGKLQNSGISKSLTNAKKRIRGLANYKNISSTAELVSSSKKKLSSGKTQTREVFTQETDKGLVTYTAIDKKIVDIKTKLKSIKQDTAEINDEQDDTNKKTTRWGKLLNSVKRVAVYRTIRAGIRMVTQAITSSLENIRSVDKELDKSMTNVSNSFVAIKNSFGVVFGNIIKSIEPHLVKIADMFANITNKINEAQAKMSGASTYTKILTSDTKEWQEQLEKVESSLLSFDKFESLTNKDQYTGVVEAPVEMEEVEAKGILATLEDIKATILGIGTAIALLKLSDLIDKLFTVKNVLGAIGIAGILLGIKETISAFKDMFNWDSTTSGLQKVLDVLRAIAGIVAVIAGLSILIHPTKIAGVALAVSAVTAIVGRKWSESLQKRPTSTGGGSIGRYANGGIPPKSELFYMNEYGKPEALVNTGGSKTNVINIDQLSFGMKQGFKDAIKESGLLDAMNSKMVVEGRNIDNNTIARGLFNALKVESERRGGNQL